MPRRRGQLSTRRVIRLSAGAVAIVLLAVGLLDRAPSRKSAPPLPKTHLAGASTTLAELRGHPVAVVFWASWCTDCHREAAAVARFASSAAGRGRILTIDYQDGGNWRAFLSRYAWHMPVFQDRNGYTGDAYGIIGLPATVFIDSTGRIVSTSSGTQTVATLSHSLAAA
ncbi:MAG TPA: TlpA disulfide reductase family protein [Solirubrobacteraceae bacterium]|jgi:cytochrome c biogenesis protein CcmG/thiol:disulfide interchange protein DsbE|nr:TlpA disulfide reductase family protein [Solirubrobacteraceae bacterium]